MRARLRLDDLVRRPRFRQQAFRLAMEHAERMPAADTIGFIDDLLGCDAYGPFIEWVRSSESIAAAAHQDYPIRIAWAERDRTIPWGRYGRPFAAAVPEAETVTMPGVGHIPMYDDPALVVRTILDVSTAADQHRSRPLSKSTDISIAGKRGTVVVRRWETSDPDRIVVIAHGLGEHSGRYDHVAERLAADGAIVYAPDHHGHGRSDGEPGLVDDLEGMVDDLAKVIALAKSEHPGLPVALLGHSLGSLIATRYVQRGDHGLSALVLSGAVVGGNPAFEALLGMDPIPDVPIDPSVLSRDPAVCDAYANDPLVYHGPLARETLVEVFAAVGAIAEGPGFGELPTLWVHGEEDALAPLGPNQEAIERLRGEVFEHEIYPGARHEVLNETNREEVLDEVAGFLDGTLARTAA
jgi:alpha-beta hydrolase superfamily lysophospholipase